MRTPLRGAALGIALLVSSLALLTLPACDECDSSIDPVKCTDLCTQSPPHRDCAQCQGDAPASDCPQCRENNAPPSCNDGGGSGGSGGNAGTVSGSGGNAGTVSGSGGSGGLGGVVSGGQGGMTGGVGGMAAIDAGPPPSCEDDDECTADRPLCSEGECGRCESNAVCDTHHEPLVLCGATGACVQCRNDGDCGDTATPHCVEGRCEECETHGDCTSNPARPQCNSARDCVACTEGSGACAEHGALMCDARAADTTATEGQCVECLVHLDCPYDTPQCNAAGECVKCDGTFDDDPCAGRVDGETQLTKCNLHPDRATTGQCVQCTGDSIALPTSNTCGNNSCNKGTGRCTSTIVDSVLPCGECVADSECDDQPELKCVAYPIAGVAQTKSYCFHDQGAQLLTDCNGATLKPFINDVHTSSVDGHEADYCLLSRSSCESYRDALVLKNCQNDDAMCGLGDLQLDGVNCIGSSPSRCSYSCESDDQCPLSQPTCSSFCRP